MFNLSGSEIVVILLLALVVLGPDKLPDAMRKAGRTFAELKKMASGFQDEVRKGFDEPSTELRKTAETIREAATVPGVTTRAKPTKPPAKPVSTSAEPADYPDKAQHNPDVDPVPDLPPGNTVAPAATAAAAAGLVGAATDDGSSDDDDAAMTADATDAADDVDSDDAAAGDVGDLPRNGDATSDASDDLVDVDDESAAVGPDLGA